MNCIKCQVPLPEGAKFCAACGTLQPEPRPTPAPGKDLCAGCGAPLGPGAAFCASCGTPVPAAAPAAPAVCAGCGSPLESGAVFCAKCGTPVPAPVLQKAPLSPKAKKAVFIGGGALAAVIALVVILVVVLSGGVHSSAENVARAAAEASATFDFETMFECSPDPLLRTAILSSTSYSNSELKEMSRSELMKIVREELLSDPDSTYFSGKLSQETAIEIVKACGSEAGDTSESEF